MVTVRERERIMLSVLYFIPSSPAYKKFSAMAIAGTERNESWGKKKKKVMNFWQGEMESHF